MPFTRLHTHLAIIQYKGLINNFPYMIVICFLIMRDALQFINLIEQLLVIRFHIIGKFHQLAHSHINLFHNWLINDKDIYNKMFYSNSYQQKVLYIFNGSLAVMHGQIQKFHNGRSLLKIMNLKDLNHIFCYNF